MQDNKINYLIGLQEAELSFLGVAFRRSMPVSLVVCLLRRTTLELNT